MSSLEASRGLWISRPDGTGARGVPPPEQNAPHRQWLDFAAVVATSLPLAFGFTENAWRMANRVADAYEETWLNPAPTEPTEEAR